MELVVSNLKAGLQIEALAQSALNAGVTNLELVVALNPNPPGVALYPGDYEGVSDPSLVELRSTVEAAGCRVASVVVLFDPAMTSARLGDAEVARLQFAMLMLKRAVDMARDLGAGLLRIVFSEQSLASQVGFLVRVVDAVAAYAAYVAGSERGDTVRVSYGVADRSLSEPVSDVKPQGSPGAVATKLLAMQRSLRAWNAGMDLALGELRVSADSLRCLREVNQFEVALTCVSWSGRVSGDLTPVLSALEDVYDGVCLLMPDADAIAATVTRARECLSDYAFNVRVFDRVKLSYPSSVARLLRPWGSARVEPDAAITAGTVGTWVYTYTAGEGGIATGGGLKLRFHHATNWDRFQLDAPAQSGFVTVSTTAEADLTARLFSEDACQVLQVTAVEGCLAEGDTIRIVIGDTSGGAPGSRAQTWAQEEFVFYTAVDRTGHGSYFELVDAPSLAIRGGAPALLKAFVPSVVCVGEPFDVKARVEDTALNLAQISVAETDRARLRIAVEVGSELIPMAETQDTSGAVLVASGLVLDAPGIYRLSVQDRVTGLIAESNPIRCYPQDAPELQRGDGLSQVSGFRVFWGDIHGHSGLMDATGTPDAYYTYGRDVAFLDFCSLSEHMDTFDGGRQASTDEQWAELKRAAAAYNQPGDFVTLLGYENSIDWDANVYFPSGDAPWYGTAFPFDLFDFAKQHNAIVIPHMTSYPHRSRGYDFHDYDADVVPVMEIFSDHGASEYFGGEKPLLNCEPGPGSYARDGLSIGCHIGFIGSGDGHDGCPGNSPWGPYINGLVAVYADELTREAVLDAIRRRRCYATTNARILADFAINDHSMGQEVVLPRDVTRRLVVTVHGTAGLAEVTIVKNGRNVRSFSSEAKSATYDLTDQAEQSVDTYYVRIKQADGNMAWLSPIWITSTDSQG